MRIFIYSFILNAILHVRSLIRFGSPMPESPSLAAQSACCVGALNNHHGLHPFSMQQGGGQDIDRSINSIRAVDLVGRVYGVSICAFPQMERLRAVSKQGPRISSKCSQS